MIINSDIFCLNLAELLNLITIRRLKLGTIRVGIYEWHIDEVISCILLEYLTATNRFYIENIRQYYFMYSLGFLF